MIRHTSASVGASRMKENQMASDEIETLIKYRLNPEQGQTALNSHISEVAEDIIRMIDNPDNLSLEELLQGLNDYTFASYAGRAVALLIAENSTAGKKALIAERNRRCEEKLREIKTYNPLRTGVHADPRLSQCKSALTNFTNYSDVCNGLACIKQQKDIAEANITDLAKRIELLTSKEKTTILNDIANDLDNPASRTKCIFQLVPGIRRLTDTKKSSASEAGI